MQNIAQSCALDTAQQKKNPRPNLKESLYIGHTPPPPVPCWWLKDIHGGVAAGFIYSSTSVTPSDDIDFDYKYSPRKDSREASRLGLSYSADLSFADVLISQANFPEIGDLPPVLQTSDGYRLDPKYLRVKRLRRTIYNAANSHTAELQAAKSRYTAWFITLTYSDDSDWDAFHITAYIKAMRAYYGRMGVKFRYVWVAEIQEKRAAKTGHHGVHYHVVLWLPKGLSVPKADKRGWWVHGLTNTQKARNPTAYLMKYASKGARFPFPKGLRTHAAGGLSSDSRLMVAWWNIPKYVRDALGDFTQKIARAVGGGWFSRLTGEVLPSLFKVTSYSPLVLVRR